MPSVTPEQLRDLLDRTEQIRCVSVIAAAGHGKTCLTDSLFCKAGIVFGRQIGDTCWDEPEREGLTVTGVGVVSLQTELEEDGSPPTPYLINVIDSSDVTAALRISDGALVVVDCIEGSAVQTEAVLRRALQERVKPCLFINKVDRCILELQMEPEDMFQRFNGAIKDVNAIIATSHDELMVESQVCPEKGTVAFGSALHGWGFSIERFAYVYAAKTGVDKDRLMKRLWGDHFFDAEKKIWSSAMQPEGASEALPRGFCQFIIRPIAQLMRALMDGDKAKYEKMMDTLGIKLKGEDKTLTGKRLMKRTLQIWISAADSLLSMIATKLPSPRQAQKYRVETLYAGPMDDAAASAIRSCDAAGPLMMYISRMAPSNRGRPYAFGRVFSGTVVVGQRVRIQGPHYKVGGEEDLNVKRIQRTVLLLGHSAECVPDPPCGNIVAILGVDPFILKTGTITTLEDAHNITGVRPVSPVVKVAVKPKDSRDLPKLVEGLRKLCKSDPLVLCTTAEEDCEEHVVAGCGELHIQGCLQDLREFAQCALTVSDFVVADGETAQELSSQTAGVSMGSQSPLPPGAARGD